MTRLATILTALFLSGYMVLQCEADSPPSSWVYYGADGTLQYRATATGDTIPDFSSAGYMQGKQLIPTVAAMQTLAPDGASDDTARIQAAIDAVSALPLDSNGFRGAVLLTAGTYNIAGQLRISASGVVLRGAGQGPTGTELYDVGTTMRDLVLAQPSTDYAYREVSGTRQQVTDSYVPVGATSFDVASTAGYHVGDKIIVNKPSTAAWITAIGMDASQMGTEAWSPSSSFIQQDRTITAINGNRITIDIPIGTSMDLNNGFGGGSIFKYTAGRISNVGVEDIRFDSNYVAPDDVNHAGRPVTFDGVSNGWIRQITSLHYQNGPIMDTSSEFITVEDTAFLDPISQPHLGGDAMNAELTLYQRNYVRNCHCDFVTQSAAPGPSVFVFCRGENSVQSTGPHQRWATATLFDNVKINGAGIELINRNTMGSGQGWAGANMVTWNCRSDWSDVESPPTAQNWAIGAVAPIRRNKYGPEGIYDSFGTPVAIHSLYIAQLKQAMGPPKPVTDTYSFSVGDNDNFVYNGASDMPYVDPDWKAIVETDMPGAGTIIGFDDPTAGRRRAATILCNLNLAPHEDLVGATLTMKLKPISDLTTNDSLFLDSPGASFDYDMLGLLPWSAGQVKTITLDLTDVYGPLLAPLQDGKFNLMMNGNMNVDSIQLNLGTAIPLVVWKGGSGNNWATSTNWTSTIGVPDNIAAKVVFGNQAAANNIVDINSPGRTVGCITFASTTSTTIQSSGGYNLTLDNNGKAAVIDVSGSHVISAAVVLNNEVNIGGSGALRISGPISGPHDLNLSGGILTLAGNNTYSGATTIYAGSLAIDSGGAINSTSGIAVGSGTLLQVTGGSSGQLPDTGNVTLNGGSINFIGNGALSAGELAGTLMLNPGQNNITTSNSGGAAPYLRFAGGPASHTTGATVNFSSTNSQIQFQTNPPDLTNGILGGYAFFNNTDFAARTTTAPYIIQQYTGYLSTDPGGSQSATTNLRPNSTITVSSTKSFNSLNLTGNYGVTLSGGSTLTLNSGGLIANTTGSISSGGTLNGSPGGELVVNTVQDFTINCPIANNGAATALVKTGAGKLKLTGLNTFTGNTYLNQGTLEYAPTSDFTYGGAISGVGNLLKTGASTLTLTGSNTYSGATTISAGRLQVNGSLDFDSSVTVGGGTLGGTGTVNGDTILNSGAIDMGASGCLGGTLTANGGSWIGVGSVTGKTIVASGALTIGNATQAGNLTANGGLEVTGSATLATGNSGATITGDFIYSSSANLNFAGIIAGTGNSVTMNNSSSTLTLSNTNTYSGLTNIVAGTLKAGNANALGGTAAGGTIINGGTLDVNGQNLTNESITVQGTGVGNNGAIINSGVQQINALKVVTLSSDTTFGGTQTPPGGTGFGRWDIRASSGATLSSGGNAYNLIKVGANQVSFVATTVDAALGDININQGFLGFQTSTNGMGDPNKTVTIASGAALEFYSTTNTMNKKCVLNGGTIWGESGSGTQNTFSGPITVNSLGGIFDAGGGLTGGAAKPSAVLTISGAITGSGGVTKNGPGTVFITGTPGYLGSTAISAGTLQIKSGAAVILHAISGAGALGVDNTTSLTAESINLGTFTIGAGSTITIAPIPGGPLALSDNLSSVPEPSTVSLFGIWALSLMAYTWRCAFRSSFRVIWKAFLGLGLLVALNTLLTTAAWAVESVWAYPGYTGRMIYRPDASGDRISDFSIVGYKQGKTAIPTVPTVVTITDDGTSDDTARIQAAINQVEAMPLGADGTRGAVLLKSGSYDIASQLTINASGVVLRGEGTGDTGTIVHARGTDQRALISISGSGSRSVTGTTYNIIDKTVPAGANSFRVDSTVGLNVGDPIYLTRPSPANWIHDIGMDQLLNDGTNDYRWTAGSKNQNWERTITRIEGNRVFLDSPVTNSLQLVYGGGSFRKYTYSGRIENVGVENMRGESDYASDTDEAHSWDFVTVNKAQNCWVSGTQARYFAYSLVTFDSDAKWCTATNNVSLLPKSQITGGRRYTYNINGQQNLVENSTADSGRHDFVLGSTTPGPNVFYNCTATNEYADAGPHHRYSTGALFDNITDLQGEINVQNRWNSGTGHGWAGANMVIWNCNAEGYVVQEVINTTGATVAKNWIIGSKGTMKGAEFAKPSGVVFPTIPLANDAQYSPKYDDSHGTNVATQSLYQAQLADATGQTNKTYQWTSGSGNWGDAQKWVQAAIPRVRGIQMRDYLIGDIDTFTYDGNADDDYYIDPAFKTQVQSQFGSNVGGFDVVAANRNLAFTHQFALAANEQILNASLALGMRSVSGSSTNDKIMIDNVGTFSLNTLGWTRSVGTTTVGMFDFGPYLAALQNGKLSVALNGNTAADWGLLSLQVGVDTQDAQVTLSGNGTVTVDSAVPAVSSVTINGTSTVLDIVSGGQLAIKDVTSQGLIRVSGGILSVSGIMDNNSRVTIAGGTLIAGSATALGSTNAVGTSITSGTLDVNGQNLTTEQITVQGAGVGNNGAIINSGVQQTSALTTVTLSGDTTFGGTQTPPGGTGFGRWDIRGTSARLSTGGHAYNLTKVGANQVSFVASTVDTAFGDINIIQGFLGFQTSTNGMGDPNKTVTIASGAALEFYSTTNAMNKKCILNGGTIWGESGSGTQNTFSGPITVNSAGGIFDAGGGLTGGTPKPSAVLTISGTITGPGGVTKNGPGTVFITGTPGYLGSTAISAGTLQINSGAAVTLHAVSGAGALGVDNTTSLTAESINLGTFTIGAGSTITIVPIPGGPLAIGGSLYPVPEPTIIAMLLTAGLAGLLLGIRYLRS